jgi:TonB family protein
MLRRTLLIISAIPILATASISSADALHPIKNWVVDYREDQCLATRDYGSPDNPITLAIRPAPNGETYELLVGRKHSGPDFATEQKGFVDFGNGRIKSWLLNYGFTKSKADVFQFTFELMSMPALLSSLQSCTADLKNYWNMDGENDGRIATPARGDMRALFSAGDYPAEALRRGQEGSIRLLLLVDEKGSVAGCHILEPSSVPVLDAMGCQVLKRRGKFTPALDGAGKPTKSTVATPRIVWTMDSPITGSRL